ncbi:MAG: ATP-dependent helicase [Bacteroidota bacterium]
MSVYLKELNPEQVDAVQAEGNVLITACPGSGKTRVITHKIAFELEKVRNTKKLLVALTYTNRAADEIKRRVEKFNIETESLWTGTIHSFCMEWIIKPYVGYIPELVNGFTIIDEIESEEIITELKEKYGVNRFASIKRIYNLDGSFETNDLRYIPLIADYKKIIHDDKKIDFDDILYYAYRLLNKYPIVSLRLSNLFELICVDEYQDTQELQYSILAEIVKSGKNKTRIFFVGDVCQAIYGSIGGIAKSKDEISFQFGKIIIEDLQLTGNYRSSQRIINYYTNYQVQPIIIKAASEIAQERGVISYDRNSHKDNIHVVISNLILDTLNRGVPPSEICVMAPQWWMILPMGRKLKSLLPHIDFDAFGLSPFRRIRENIWFKIIRLFLTTPATSNYGVRYQWAAELLIAMEEFVPSFLNNINNRRRFLLRVVNYFKSTEESSLNYINNCFEYFIREFAIPMASSPELNARKEIFDVVINNELQKEEFDYANEINVLKRVFNSKSGVVVSTCHGVKGEEYDTVIAFGLLDGFIPNWNDPDALASNKLLYVMCSRAKNHLYLISERGHNTRISERGPTPVLVSVRYVYD